MKTSLSLKTLLRTPLKTLVTFLLLAATSYLLFFSVAEFSAVSREMERAVDFYKGVGAAEAEPARQELSDEFWGLERAQEYRYPAYGTDLYLYTDKRVKNNPYGEDMPEIGYKGLRQSDIDAIRELPYVTDTSVRYMTAGVSDYLLRSDSRNDFYNYTARFIVQASLGDTLVSYIPSTQSGGLGRAWLPFNYFRILTDDQQRYGRELNFKLTIVWVREFDPEYTGGRRILSDSSSRNSRLMSTIHTRAEQYDDVYNYDFLSSLVTRERYIIVGRMDPSPNGSSTYFLGDPTSIGRYPQVYALRDQPDNYLELEEFAPLRELIELTNADIHTFDVVYTDDMSSIMRVAEGNMAVSKGRLLSPGDSEQKNNVCVMHDGYMTLNGLKIGDKIKLKLGDKLFEQNAALGAVAVVAERQSESYTEVEFEIVGAYKDTDTKAQQAANLHWTYSVNTVFVPLPFLQAPIPADHEIKPGEFSFTIDNPRSISAFLNEALPIIEGELGLTLIFTDGGWSALESQMNQAKTLATARLLILAVAVAVAICLTVYLFIGRKRKEYAIMRALGTPSHRASRSLYLPLGVLGVLAIALGNVLGYLFTGERIGKVLEPFAEVGGEAAATVPAYLVPACCACVLMALAAASAFMLYKISKKPPLELLQAGANRAAAKQIESAISAEAAPVRRTATGNSTAHAGKHLAKSEKTQAPARHIVSYVTRHIRRMPAKSLLSSGLALLLLCAVGQLTVIRGAYGRMYDEMEQKAYVTNSFSIKTGLQAAQFDYIDSVYYENKILQLKSVHEAFEIIMTNDIERFGNGKLEINFLEGYDYSTQGMLDDPDFGAVNRTCVMDSVMMERLDLSLGDEVRMINAYVQNAIMMELYLIPPGSPEQQREREEAVDYLLDNHCVYYTVVGEITSGGSATMIITPVGRGLNRVLAEGDRVFDYAEYTLTSPAYAEEFRAYVEPRITGTVGDLGSPFVMDTSAADNTLQTLALLNTLYPVAIVAAAILSGLFPGLIVMQSDREAAIMRVLGTTKRRTRTILVSEQATLCFIGQLCAVVLLLVINGILLFSYTETLGLLGMILLAACSAGALICAVIITRRRVLELLQVKE